jgi:hypothetical protein
VKNTAKTVGVLLIVSLPLLLPDLCGADRISLKVTAGLNYAVYGDINAGARGYLNDWKDQVIFVGGSYVDNAKPLHTGPIYSVDLVYKIGSNYSVGLGVGYVRANNRSEVTLRWPSGPETTAVALPDVRAIPIRLSVIKILPIDKMMDVFFAAGIDTYFAQYRSSNWPGGPGNVDHQKASAIGVGVRYGVGLDIKFASSLAFFLEGQGCYAKVRGFHGTLKSAGSTLPYEEHGTLYYYNFMGGQGNQTPYPTVLIHDTKPSEDVYSNVRQARVDFSGFSVLAGIKIFF